MRPADPTVSRRSVRRVAIFATLFSIAIYILAACVADVVALAHLTTTVDNRLSERLSDVEREYLTTDQAPPVGIYAPEPAGDLDDAPIVTWFVSKLGQISVLDKGAPLLPAVSTHISKPSNQIVGGHPFRLDGALVDGGRFIVGTSTSAESSLLSTLIVIELLIAPFAMLAVFGSAWLIGRRAAAPVERARVQQQDFVANASHELRTPLTVIEAELGLALSREREAPEYQVTLERITRESARMRTLVEELLWLSRVDATSKPERNEQSDLCSVVLGCIDRFGVVANSRGLRLYAGELPNSALVRSPADWLDQLVSVLLDNACKYSNSGGDVRLTVHSDNSGIRLLVEDSGPGVSEIDRERIFNRFQRSDHRTSGAGLGLAIADAVVRGTGARWEVGDSILGGARFDVIWPTSGHFHLGSGK